MDGKPEEKVVNNICCMGVDYVGVLVSCVIAHKCPSLNVAVVDFNPSKLSMWNTKQIPTREPGVEEIIKKCQNKNLVFTTDIEGAIRTAEVIFISMNTPLKTRENGEDMSPDLAEIEKAARMIAKTAKIDKIVVENSTVPVGSTEALSRILDANKNEGVKFQVVSNPHFFSPGSAVENLSNPNRILIGNDLTPDGIKAGEAVASIYRHWVPNRKILTISMWSSELVKLSVNALLAQRLSSINALSMICEKIDTDVTDVAKILGMSSAIGSAYLEPSLGFGGAYLKKDLLCLIYMCKRLGLTEVAEYWNRVIAINEFQKERFKLKILTTYFHNVTHKKFAIWGFAYKKNVEFVTDSPAVYLCRSLLEEGAKLNIYDPKTEKRQVMESLRSDQDDRDWEKDIAIFDDPYKAAYKCHAIILCTDCEEFQNLDYAIVYRDMMRPAYVFDGRKCLPHDELISQGFMVKTIGKLIPET